MYIFFRKTYRKITNLRPEPRDRRSPYTAWDIGFRAKQSKLSKLGPWGKAGKRPNDFHVSRKFHIT